MGRVMNALADLWGYLGHSENWGGEHGILQHTRAHLWISLVAIAISTALAVPPAVWLAHRHRWPLLSAAIVNIGRAVPSFAIIVAVFPLSIRYGFGLGFWPTCVALAALGIPPIYTNAYTGVAHAAPEIVEAARGIGMTDVQVLTKVELPSALPLILTGVRVSAVQIVATATLGAVVGYECLGTPIVQGLVRGDAGRGQLLGGALLVIVVALAVDAALGMLVPRAAPWNERVR